jgi:hypothetical protein
MSFGRSERGMARNRREYGVYLVKDKYYISTWPDLPYSDTDPIKSFYADDKRDALIQGEKIAEEHHEEQMKLPEDKRVHTIPKKPYIYQGYGNGMYGDGFGG